MYAYYHCYNRHCDTRANYPLPDVHEEFVRFLSEASAKPHAIAHLKHYLRRINELIAAQSEDLRHKQDAETRRAQEQIKELIRLKVDQLISDEEFREQRSAISGRMVAPEVGGITELPRVDSVLRDLDSISEYLTNLPNAWERVAPQFQRRFQQIAIPDGYAVGSVGTAPKGRLLSFIAAPLPADTNGVPPVCDSWNQLAFEIQSLAVVFCESSML